MNPLFSTTSCTPLRAPAPNDRPFQPPSAERSSCNANAAALVSPPNNHPSHTSAAIASHAPSSLGRPSASHAPSSLGRPSAAIASHPPSLFGRTLAAHARRLTTFLLFAFALSGYTWKSQRLAYKKGAALPPYLALLRASLQRRDLPLAARFLQTARTCWQINREACGFTQAQYLRLLGIFYLETSQPAEAITVLQTALRLLPPPTHQGEAPLPTKDAPKTTEKTAFQKKTPSPKQHHPTPAPSLQKDDDPRLISFYLGQAFFRLERYREAIPPLQRAETIAQDHPGWYLLLGQSLAKTGLFEPARQTFFQGLSRFPNHLALLHAASLLYADAGLFDDAIRLGWRAFHASAPPDPSLLFDLADRLRQKGLLHAALELLESLRLAFRSSLYPSPRPTPPPLSRASAPPPRLWSSLLRRLAVVYSEAKMPFAAALSFAALARLEPAMALYASDAFRAAGDLPNALAWNLRIPDPHHQTLHRAEIFLAQGHHLRAFSLLWPLWKAQNLPPQGRYHLAYSALRLGRFDLLPPLLLSLQKTPFQTRIPTLQAALSACRTSPWLCLP